MTDPGSRPFRCFDGRYLARIGVPVVVALGIAIVAKGFEKGTAIRFTLIGIECVLFGYVIIETVRSIRRLDELAQRIHLVAIAISFTLTAVLAMALSLLEKSGMPAVGWQNWLWPFMTVAWGVGVLIISRRYV